MRVAAETTGDPRSNGAAAAIEDLPLAWRPFPIDSLTGCLPGFVGSVALSLDCEPAMVALPALGALAGCVGSTRVVSAKPGYTEPIIIWAGVVAASGEMKSPAFKEVFRPLWSRETQAFQEHQEAMKRHRRDRALYEQALREQKRGQGEALPEEPEAPKARRIIVKDHTVEALKFLLADNARGLVVGANELAKLLKSFDAYRQGRGADSADWLELYDAEPINVDRRGGESVHVERPCVSVAGGIQPGVAQRVFNLERDEEGLTWRFIFASPPARENDWTEATVPARVRDGYDDLVDQLLRLRHDGDGKPIVLKLSDDAKRAYVAFHREVGQERINETSDDVRSMLNKARAKALRIAGLLHLVDLADSNAAALPEPVSLAAMEGAITVTRWSVHEMRRFLARRIESDEQRKRREVLELAQRGAGCEISARDLMNRRRKAFPTVKVAEAFLKSMEAAGLGTAEYPPTKAQGGRQGSLVFRVADGRQTREGNTDAW